MKRLRRQTMLIALLTFISLFAAGQTTYGTFRDWNYSPTSVYGLEKLDNAAGRTRCVISPVDENQVKIETVNPVGIVTKSTIVTFANGHVKSITNRNSCGFAKEIIELTKLDSNKFMVTARGLGRNELLPSKGQKLVFKSDFQVEAINIGFDGNVSTDSRGVAIKKFINYDEGPKYSLIKEDLFFDASGSPTLSSVDDCHRMVYEYNNHGNQTLVSYFGTRGQPVPNRTGIYRTAKVFDSKDNEIESTGLGPDGKIMNNVFGFAKTKTEYKNGLKIKTTCYNAKGKIVKESDAGSGVAITRYEYDQNGNQVKESYYDERGNAMNNPIGIHEIADHYSDQNMLLTRDYFDKDELPANDEQGIHHYVCAYNSNGIKIQEAFYGKNGLPARSLLDQVYMIKYKCDSLGRHISASFWENENTKMRRWDGFYEMTNKYNAEGQITEEAYRDKNGDEVVNDEGISKVISLYDPNCRLSQRLFLTAAIR